jgi:hypothetical protein
MCAENISAGVDGGHSGGSRVRRPGSEDPHRCQRKFYLHWSAGLAQFLQITSMTATLQIQRTFNHVHGTIGSIQLRIFLDMDIHV